MNVESEVVGLIDMGDIHSAPYIFEVGMAAMYMGLECKTMNQLDAPAHMLAGYLSSRNITDKEFSILKVTRHGASKSTFRKNIVQVRLQDLIF